MNEATSQALRAVLSAAREIGLAGPSPLDDQLGHSLAFADLVEGALSSRPGRRVLDLGSGGGLPGLVLAAAVSGIELVLLDGSSRRAEWLRSAVETMGWDESVVVLEARAEEAGRDPRWRGSFDVVTARSFARPGVTAECAAPLLAPGGTLVVSEPPRREAAEGTTGRWPEEQLRLLGLSAPEEIERRRRHFVLLTLEGPCPERYPRRVGIPEKRPLF